MTEKRKPIYLSSEDFICDIESNVLFVLSLVNNNTPVTAQNTAQSFSLKK